MAKPMKKQRLVAAAQRISHAKGFSRMTLADVAAESGVPLGNVYYYFRTKETLGAAVVDALIEQYRGQRAQWQLLPDAKRRLVAWLDATDADSAALARSGCPIGSLCIELAKSSPPLRKRAQTVFSETLDFAEHQFRRLGAGKAAKEHALHFVAALEGATLLANAYNDAAPLRRETQRLRRWIDNLCPEDEAPPAKRASKGRRSAVRSGGEPT
jgi:AcrR family transcriptional regulator